MDGFLIFCIIVELVCLAVEAILAVRNIRQYRESRDKGHLLAAKANIAAALVIIAITVYLIVCHI